MTTSQEFPLVSITIDVADFLKYLKERYSDHTAKSYVNYFRATKSNILFLGPYFDVLSIADFSSESSLILSSTDVR